MTGERSNAHGLEVRKRILEMGLTLWRVDPAFVSARRIAHELGLSHSAVLYHFVTSSALRDAIAFHAVKQGESRVIVSLIGMKHPAVASMDDAQRLEHMRYAVG
jgi:AcrR family transcriptional regulator